MTHQWQRVAVGRRSGGHWSSLAGHWGHESGPPPSGRWNTALLLRFQWTSECIFPDDKFLLSLSLSFNNYWAEKALLKSSLYFVCFICVASLQTHHLQLNEGVSRTVDTLAQLCICKSTLHLISVQIFHRQREVLRAVHTGPDPFTHAERENRAQVLTVPREIPDLIDAARQQLLCAESPHSQLLNPFTLPLSGSRHICAILALKGGTVNRWNTYHSTVCHVW